MPACVIVSYLSQCEGSSTLQVLQNENLLKGVFTWSGLLEFLILSRFIYKRFYAAFSL